jgi:hypothetical protein
MNPARRRTTAAAATAVVLTTAGGLLTAVATPASAVTSCTSPVFKRQFFANTTLTGTPKRTDCDSAIDQSWSGAPTSGLRSDNFGVRWTVTRDFGSGGPFAFKASGTDGIRVYLDGVRKINLWSNTASSRSTSVNLTIPKGSHTLRVDYVNWTGKAAVKFTYAPRTSATVDKVKPLTPTGPKVAYDGTTRKAKASWAKNKEMDLSGYRVYRRLKGSSSWTGLPTTTSTTYTDAPPATGQVFYYEVRARDKAGNESGGTADLAVTTVDRTAPAVPTGLSTSAYEAEGLRVGWTKVADAVSYRVYRATSADGTYAKVAATSQVSHLDTSAAEGGTYYYRVTSLDAAGNESARSAAVSGTRPDLTAPSAVTGLVATPTDYGFELKWDPNPTPDLARYVVYGGQVIRDGEDTVCYASPREWLSPGTTSYTYTTVPDGEERCFWIDAEDAAGNSHYEQTREPDIVFATELDLTPGEPTPEGGTEPLTAGDRAVIALTD